MVNLLLVRRLEVTAANWKEATTQIAEKSVLETIIEFHLDILIAHI